MSRAAKIALIIVSVLVAVSLLVVWCTHRNYAANRLCARRKRA